MKLSFLNYISPGYYAMKDSQEGLECIREFENKSRPVRDKEELETLIREYEKRIGSIPKPKNTALLWLSMIAPYLPAFAIPNGNIAVFYVLGVATAQLSDWTRRIRKFKTDNNLWSGKWHSHYPYKKKFEEKCKRLVEQYNTFLT